MKNKQIAYNIKSLCKANKKTISQMLLDCDISKSLIYDMERRDKAPSCDKLSRIADYLGCSVDYLLGRTDEPFPTTAAAISSTDIETGSAAASPGTTAARPEDAYASNKSHLFAFSIADNPVSASAAPRAIAIPKPKTAQERQLLNLYQSMNQEGQEKVLNYAEDLSASGKYRRIL